MLWCAFVAAGLRRETSFVSVSQNASIRRETVLGYASDQVEVPVNASVRSTDEFPNDELQLAAEYTPFVDEIEQVPVAGRGGTDLSESLLEWGLPRGFFWDKFFDSSAYSWTKQQVQMGFELLMRHVQHVAGERAVVVRCTMDAAERIDGVLTRLLSPQLRRVLAGRTVVVLGTDGTSGLSYAQLADYAAEQRDQIRQFDRDRHLFRDVKDVARAADRAAAKLVPMGHVNAAVLAYPWDPQGVVQAYVYDSVPTLASPKKLNDALLRQQRSQPRPAVVLIRSLPELIHQADECSCSAFTITFIREALEGLEMVQAHDAARSDTRPSNRYRLPLRLAKLAQIAAARNAIRAQWGAPESVKGKSGWFVRADGGLQAIETTRPTERPGENFAAQNLIRGVLQYEHERALTSDEWCCVVFAGGARTWLVGPPNVEAEWSSPDLACHNTGWQHAGDRFEYAFAVRCGDPMAADFGAPLDAFARGEAWRQATRRAAAEQHGRAQRQLARSPG